MGRFSLYPKCVQTIGKLLLTVWDKKAAYSRCLKRPCRAAEHAAQLSVQWGRRTSSSGETARRGDGGSPGRRSDSAAAMLLERRDASARMRARHTPCACSRPRALIGIQILMRLLRYARCEDYNVRRRGMIKESLRVQQEGKLNIQITSYRSLPC